MLEGTRCAGEGTEVRVEILVDRIRVTIADNGRGIPEAELPRVFEPFYRADASRTDEHSGLGLRIAKGLIEAHGGRLRLESVEGRGTKVAIEFPTQENAPGS